MIPVYQAFNGVTRRLYDEVCVSKVGGEFTLLEFFGEFGFEMDGVTGVTTLGAILSCGLQCLFGSGVCGR